jgi:E1A/CREB-binding protein
MIFSKEILKDSLLASLHKLYEVPESTIFQSPVDVIAMPRYGDVIKNPIDLGTIRHKVLCNEYSEPWEYINDIRLMFSNAWTFNKKNTFVYIYCTQVNKYFIFIALNLMNICIEYSAPSSSICFTVKQNI